MTVEHRHFTRIPFDAPTTISQSSSDINYKAELIDISFKGLLIKKPSDWQDSEDKHYKVHAQLAGEDVVINLNVIAIHSDEDSIGFQIEQMDLNTATHLRRIVELNLGDEALLERELYELIQVK